MTFGDYEYGAVPDDEQDDVTVEQAPPDHPASVQQCDHPNCKNDTPEHGQRICGDCTLIMDPDQPDRCSYCGASLANTEQ